MVRRRGGGDEREQTLRSGRLRRHLSRPRWLRSSGDGTAVGARAESDDTSDGGGWLYEFSIPAALCEIPTARRRVAGYAKQCGLAGPALFDLLLAVGEALANAVKHGSPRREADRVWIRVGLAERGVMVEVRDQGPGFMASRICHPEAHESSGRGIPFMRALLDDLRFDCRPEGTVVLLEKDFE